MREFPHKEICVFYTCESEFTEDGMTMKGQELGLGNGGSPLKWSLIYRALGWGRSQWTASLREKRQTEV